MRYTEKEYDYNYSNVKDWFQHLVALLLVAPLRLFNEISTKFIYLKRSLISKVLNLSVILDAIVLLIYSGIQLWLKDFDVWKGKIPIILQIFSFIILLCIDLWYHFYDFMIYKHLNELLPIATAVDINDTHEFSNENAQSDTVTQDLNKETDSVNSFEQLNDDILSELLDIDNLNLSDLNLNSNHADVDGIVSELLQQQELPTETSETLENFRISDSEDKVFDNSDYGFDLQDVDKDILAMLNEDLVNDEDTIAYKNTNKILINEMDTIDSKSLKEEMDSSEDPSKYVPEDNLFMFLQDLGADSFGTIDSFTGWDIPEGLELI